MARIEPTVLLITILPAQRYAIKTHKGTAHIIIGYDADTIMPYEIITHVGNADPCMSSECEAVGRLCSLAFRSGIDPHKVIRQLIDIQCEPISETSIRAEVCRLCLHYIYYIHVIIVSLLARSNPYPNFYSTAHGLSRVP